MEGETTFRQPAPLLPPVPQTSIFSLEGGRRAGRGGGGAVGEEVREKLHPVSQHLPCHLYRKQPFSAWKEGGRQEGGVGRG